VSQQGGQFQRTVTLHAVTSAIHHVDHRIATTALQFRDVGIVDDRGSSTTYQRDRAVESFDQLPQAGSNTGPGFAAWVAASVVSPRPTEVVELPRIVQDSSA
jgi:hypothetical protein